MTITILLTSTVNVNMAKYRLFQKNKHDRLTQYLKTIKQWLYYTQFRIVLVENSGYYFTELSKELEQFNNRFEIIPFTEDQLTDYQQIKHDRSKGVSEIYAINYAFEHSKLLPTSTFIIKVTARFYIPELENYLKNYDLDQYDCLVQHNHNRCELVGCHINQFNHVFSKNIINQNNQYDGHIENIYRFRCSQLRNRLTCQEFKIEPTQRGGMNQYYHTI